MENEIQRQLEEFAKECSKNKMPFVCRMVSTDDGLKYVVERIKSIISANPDLSLDNALGHVELELNETSLY